ncbi:MAG: D-alanyl-D-alanine carboxypeptidase [Dorea sp.]|jgi:D-alanyl-D-alanine carboxypeptidase (penicillin-binding protein 5/6)|nr:D-alanyl-D-alanine carboxypeptidase [Dorea sp.]
MAEFVCGSEEEFVNQMNERARGLGMEHTNFVNCNGLDAEGHETTARDIALMSKELLTKYPQIHDYATIWMENITHHTRKGSSEFGLTNTNKLIRQYQYATGLKTGSTSDAGFCVSATAEKNQMELIAVIMAAKDSKSRFQDATALLNYGFGKCIKYMDEGIETIKPAKVEKGMETEVPVEQAEGFQYIDTAGADLSGIEKKPEMKKHLKAPVKQGDKVGEMVYFLNGKEIGRADIIAAEDVGKMKYKNALETALEKFFM